MKQRGILIVNTGDGKGKSTAAFGTAFRAAGHGFKVCIIQFIKHPCAYGEIKAGQMFDNIEWYTEGEGFTWNSKDLEKDKARAKKGFELAKEKINSGKFDLVVLDELTYLPQYEFMDIDEIIPVIKNRPENLDIIVTGRGAHEKLIEIADTVTEMKPIKHAYENGIKAKKGIEF